MLYYFKKGENTTEMQSKICAVYGEGAVTDWSVKMACKVLCWRLLTGWLLPQLKRAVEVDSNQTETLTENNPF